jgi:hypothetical protein
MVASVHRRRLEGPRETFGIVWDRPAVSARASPGDVRLAGAVLDYGECRRGGDIRGRMKGGRAP